MESSRDNAAHGAHGAHEAGEGRGERSGAPVAHLEEGEGASASRLLPRRGASRRPGGRLHAAVTLAVGALALAMPRPCAAAGGRACGGSWLGAAATLTKARGAAFSPPPPPALAGGWQLRGPGLAKQGSGLGPAMGGGKRRRAAGWGLEAGGGSFSPKGDEGEEEGPGEGDPYGYGDDDSSSKGICRALETSFRRVWLRLFSTGPDDNYASELKGFVLGTIAAYDAGYSQPALILELGRHELETGDPNVDKTVRLTDQERQTREVWLVLVYLTLHRLSYKPASDNIPQPPADSLGLGSLVVSTCEAFDAGFSLEGLRLELTVSAGDAPPVLTPAQLSLRSQWTRIVFITCQIVTGRKKR